MKARSGARRALLIAGALALARCGPPPKPPVVPPPVPTAAPAPTPPPTATPAPPVFVEVAEPRLDISLLTDRASFTLPAGSWLVRSAAGLERRAGPLTFSARGTTGAPLFSVQAGSFGTRQAADHERDRIAELLGLEVTVVDVGERFSLRVGAPAPRAELDALLKRVRAESAPDAFLVGAAAPPAGATVQVAENGTARELPSPLEVAAADGSPFPSEEGTYRGHLVVRATGRGTIHVIDRVNLEDYLKGVVPSEMGPRVYDELEALKAQTVAARSYALRRRGDFAAEGYDLCATPRCQAYGGVGVEQPLTNTAVDATAGEVLLFGGEIADALFTSTCGGRTENAASVFPAYGARDVPYLSSVPCHGEEQAVLAATAAPPATAKPVTLLGLRGRALLASEGRRGTTWADLKEARAAVQARLGLAPHGSLQNLSPEAVYADLWDLLEADLSLLVEPVEVERAPRGWSERARRAYAFLSRFAIANGTVLPVDRVLTAEEAAGLWASLLARMGDLDEIEGRLVSVAGGTLVVKGAKGRQEVPLGAPLVLFRGSPDVYAPIAELRIVPGERVRAFVRGGSVHAVAAAAAPTGELYERESSWVHWTRRFTGAELAAKLAERDPSRKAREVRRVDVLSRGASGRAERVRVTTDRETVVLSGLEIRFAMGLPETLFTVVRGASSGDPVFTFFGRAWGHGVGLCQNGAFGMALAGRTYREILAHYYRGAEIGPAPAPR